MSISVRKNIESLKPYVPGKPIEEVEREYGINNAIKLASNENCLGPSPKAVSAIKKGLADINRYPDAASFYLKKKLAAFLKVGEDSLTIGNGSDEVIVIAIRAFIGPGDEVIIAKPTFLIYEIASQIQGVDVKFVPLTADLKYDLVTMKAAVTNRTKMIFIANPDNPTGTYVTRDELNLFFKDLPDSVIVYLDEAYFEFAGYSSIDYPRGLDYLDRPNVIVGRSFSKAYGLAGLRVGYGVSNPDIISYMERVRDPFNVNLLAQKAAIAALDDQEFLVKTLKHVAREKEFLYKELDSARIRYVKTATNFILVDVQDDCKAIYSDLLKKGVIVRDMKAWGFNSFIRVTIGTREENRKFLAALKDVI